MCSFQKVAVFYLSLIFCLTSSAFAADAKKKFPEPVNTNCHEQRVDAEGHSYRGSDLAGPDLAAIKEAARILKTSHPALSEKLLLVAARHQ